MLKAFLYTLIFIFSSVNVFAQSETAKPYPDSVKNVINKEIEKKVIIFKRKFNMDYQTQADLKFAVDTFKIWERLRLRQNFDFSTAGMNNSVIELTEAYQKILNEYYNKLLKSLLIGDRSILITSQRNWIKFRDSERKMIWLMADNSLYNSGGTIQTNFAYGNYLDIVQKRAEEIFEYYNSIVEKKEIEKAGN